MKRYIILSAMLVAALTLSAQTTDNGRTTRQRSSTGTAVQEKKASEEPKKAEVKTEREPERKVISPSTPQTTTNESGTRTRTRPSGNENPAYERRSSTPVTPERKRETTITREREVKSGNTGREISTTPGRTPREPERSNERTVTRESDRNRSVSPDRTVPTRRTETTVNNNVYVPRNDQETIERRRAYSTPERRVIVRTVSNPTYVHRPIEYRRTYYPYRAPVHMDIIWDVHLYHEYRYLYPHYDYWYYPVGYRVQTVSAYDAERYIGEFARIYGKVYEAWYNRESDELYLYFGEPYPYQDFTVIISGNDARRYSRRPDRYFTGRHVAVTGVVSVFEGKPEMVIKRRSQIDLYF